MDGRMVPPKESVSPDGKDERLRMEREIPKNASAFFAKQQSLHRAKAGEGPLWDRYQPRWRHPGGRGRSRRVAAT